MTMKPYPVFILCGGLGTRLSPLSDNLPKSLVPVLGVPFIVYQLQLLERSGIQEVVLCLGRLGDQIINFIEQTRDLKLTIRYSFDGETLLGTGGAIKQALDKSDSDHFFVMYGDSYCEVDFLDIQASYLKQGRAGLMSIYHNQNAYDRSNLIVKNKEILLYDKSINDPRMDYIDYGVSIFEKSVFWDLTDNQFDLSRVYQELIAEGQLSAYEVTERFFEIGSFVGIKDFEQNLIKE